MKWPELVRGPRTAAHHASGIGEIAEEEFWSYLGAFRKDYPARSGVFLCALTSQQEDVMRSITERRQGHVRSAVRLGGAIGTACTLLIAATGAQPLDNLCGATIVADLKLDHDVVCVGDGLIAGADGIWIDLDGYTLSGSGTGVGIVITGRRELVI